MGYQSITTRPVAEKFDQENLVALGRNVTENVAVDSIVASTDSPRLTGEDKDHTQRLAEVFQTLPPILVHRQSMTVIDGMHRLKAAQLRGLAKIPVEFFEGNSQEAFLYAVKANTTHGLPLTLKERRTATRRIIATYPLLSDRAIAAYVGLSDKTVGMIRRSSDGNLESDTRLGADGRIRPLNNQRGRLRAADIISKRPTASLREVAEEAGVSVGTAHHVRQRLRRGEGSICGGRRSEQTTDSPGQSPASGDRPRVAANPRPDRSDAIDQGRIMGSLIKDPALRHAERGRRLLRWLQAHVVTAEHCDMLVEAVPAHRRGTVARIARECEQIWGEFAQKLEQQDADTK